LVGATSEAPPWLGVSIDQGSCDRTFRKSDYNFRKSRG
jgi:hypothetical protein